MLGKFCLYIKDPFESNHQLLISGEKEQRSRN